MFLQKDFIAKKIHYFFSKKVHFLVFSVLKNTIRELFRLFIPAKPVRYSPFLWLVWA